MLVLLRGRTCACLFALDRREVDYRIQRARVPGAGTEMLGLIFQGLPAPSTSNFKAPTVQDKFEKLVTLHQRLIQLICICAWMRVQMPIELCVSFE